jgi:hypothetical protein
MKDKQLIHIVFEKVIDQMDTFIGDDQSCYVTATVAQHQETLAVGSDECNRLFQMVCYNTTKELLNRNCVREVSELVQAHTQVAQEENRVFNRTASYGGNTYLDKGDKDWQVIEVSEGKGFKTLSLPPDGLKFVRAKGMKSLPTPEKGGSLDQLKKYLKLRNESQWYLIVVWILAALHPLGPYMLLVINGGAGSAKTTVSRLLRDLIDPNIAPLRSLPRGERDLFIAAKNSWLMAVDNISFLSDEMSDAFCRLATRAAFITRKLRTDSQEQIFDVCRPALFNGIQEFCFRTDFLDRAVQINLERISDKDRKRSQDVEQSFESEKSLIFGALLDALSLTMAEIPNVSPGSLPRMADFGVFALAVEKALHWPDGSVMNAYDKMRRNANEAVLESCPYVDLVLDLAQKGWKGSAAELMDKMERKYCEDVFRKKGFPKGLPQLSGQLTRLAPAFRTKNVDIQTGKTSGTGSERYIALDIFDGEKFAGDVI